METISSDEIKKTEPVSKVDKMIAKLSKSIKNTKIEEN